MDDDKIIDLKTGVAVGALKEAASAAPVEPLDPGKIRSADALNFFSFSVMREAKKLIDAGIDEDWFITLYLDHAAAFIARREPRHRREHDLEKALEKLRGFVSRKVAERRRDNIKRMTGKA
jgi:hypothetical protein